MVVFGMKKQLSSKSGTRVWAPEGLETGQIWYVESTDTPYSMLEDDEEKFLDCRRDGKYLWAQQ